MMTMGLTLVGIIFVLGVSFQWKHSQLFGAMFCGLLGYASFHAGFIANALLNTIFLSPLSFYGWYVWDRRETEGNLSRSLPKKYLLGALIATIGATMILSIATVAVQGSLPILDALTAVMPVIATILMVGAYKEQWYWWVPLNALQCFMWFTAMTLNPAMTSVFILKIVFLINSIIGFYIWKKE